MAGEWLKFDCSLPEKPEVLAITVAMGWDDPDLTVGKLMRLFRWFDQHTVDGNAQSVTPALLDRIVGVTGFVSAVAKAGWIVITDVGVSLKNFDRHNGATAKGRALTAKRVANHKANAKGNGVGNAESVSSALPREEKRREEINTPKPPSGADVRFDRFWSAYPKKVGKDAARKAFDKRKPSDVLVGQMLAAIAVQAASEGWQRDGGQFIPNPATWLNQGRWQDETINHTGDASSSQFAGFI